ncbi:unnamed protein product [Peniophora sp. CBMAI 1063]|nr:unnamed protein product [Peniophora sp. CBMAI 1063]
MFLAGLAYRLYFVSHHLLLAQASRTAQTILSAVVEGEPHRPPWAQPPPPDATGHLIFGSMSGLPLRWPNTMRKNGHTIAPGRIPLGTMLYHGTYLSNGTAPTTSDWLGFDAEVGYLYCGNPCRIASYVATRDLKVLYFDGFSAAKVPNSSHMETQDLLAWGSIHHERIRWEPQRLKALCDWGREFGIDGFVRMQWDFELMYCDIAEGLRLVELSDLPPQSDALVGNGQPPRPAGWKGELMSGTHTYIEAFLAGQRHDRLPGEARVRINFGQVVSFYDPALSSLFPGRRGKSRAHHNIQDISPEDIFTKLQEVRSVLTREELGSGLDWPALFQAVYDRYADRLQTLNDTLASADATIAHMKNARQFVLALLVHHMRPTDVPQVPGQSDVSWMSPVVERCSRSPATHVKDALFTPQERLLRDAVGQTLHEICRRLGLIWIDAFDIENVHVEERQAAASRWRTHIRELLQYLDWPQFNRCVPGCAIGEMCYISMVPYPWPEDAPDNITPRCISQKYRDWPSDDPGRA